MRITKIIGCNNQVKTENGSVLCGIYQIENGIKYQWICEECLDVDKKGGIK
jgi:hypothetical protein